MRRPPRRPLKAAEPEPEISPERLDAALERLRAAAPERLRRQNQTASLRGLSP